MNLIKLPRSFPRIFITCSDYSTGTLSAEFHFFEHVMLDTCFVLDHFFAFLDL